MPDVSEIRTADFQTHGRIGAVLLRNRSWILATLCGYAFLRVLILSLAFPLFNPLDEQDHFETVVRYAQGKTISKELPQTEPELARIFAIYGSPEYQIARSRLHAAGLDVPVTRLPVELRVTQLEKRYRYWSTQRDIEAQSPPAYYAMAAIWHRVGAELGAKDWARVYWVRGFNAILYGMFVWISGVCVREVFAENAFLIVAVPGLLAVLPQDVFFGVNREALSPLVVALALLLLSRGLKVQTMPELWLVGGAVLTGIGFLTDVSNFVLFGSMALVLLFYAKKNTTVRKTSRYLTVVSALVTSILPPICWMARNRVITGDLTGSRAKIAFLGWTVKPRSEIWQHPIFSAQGAGYFLTELTKRYWRGEYVWGGVPMAWTAADWYYVLSSVLFVVAFGFCLVQKKGAPDETGTWFEVSSLALIIASVVFLAVISLLFDFHECFYPSRANPYFVSGRIICGTILPFAVIYLRGFEYLWRPLRSRIHPIIPVVTVCATITLVEFYLRVDVFRSAFNFFALRRE